MIPLEGLLMLALVAMTLNLAGACAIEQPTPQLIQKTVKTGILSIVWLHVGLVPRCAGLSQRR